MAGTAPTVQLVKQGRSMTQLGSSRCTAHAAWQEEHSTIKQKHSCVLPCSGNTTHAVAGMWERQQASRPGTSQAASSTAWPRPHLDLRVWVANCASIVGGNEGHAPLSKLAPLHLAQLVRRLLLTDAVGHKTPLGVIQQPAACEQQPHVCWKHWSPQSPSGKPFRESCYCSQAT